MTYIARSARKDAEKFMAETKGKCFGDFEILKSDAERAWEQGVPLGEEEYDEE